MYNTKVPADHVSNLPIEISHSKGAMQQEGIHQYLSPLNQDGHPHHRSDKFHPVLANPRKDHISVCTLQESTNNMSILMCNCAPLCKVIYPLKEHIRDNTKKNIDLLIINFSQCGL